MDKYYLKRRCGKVGLSGGVSPPAPPPPPTTICCSECFLVTLLKGAPSFRGPRGEAEAIPVAASMAAVDPAEADGAIPIMGPESIEA